VRIVDAFLRRYALGEAADVLPFVVGPRVLDLGAGEGWVTAALARHGLATCGADVGPFARIAIPYVVYDGTRLPFGDGSFDTTLLLLTLHHCDKPEIVLGEAIRVTRARLIVTESVVRNRLDRFWLDLLDGRFNRLRHDGLMPVPLGFRGAREWRALFASRGLTAIDERRLGGRVERLIHHPRLFVLNV
jgi:SAM-dependent methyltransferase